MTPGTVDRLCPALDPVRTRVLRDDLVGSRRERRGRGLPGGGGGGAGAGGRRRRIGRNGRRRGAGVGGKWAARPRSPQVRSRQAPGGTGAICGPATAEPGRNDRDLPATRRPGATFAAGGRCAAASRTRRDVGPHQAGRDGADDGEGGARRRRHAGRERDRPSTGAWASHDSGPIASRSRPSEMLRKARTTRGSNWSPRSGRSRRERPPCPALVRAHGGHDVEDVGDGDDAPASEIPRSPALRVAVAVPALVVLGDRVRPLAEPARTARPAGRRARGDGDRGPLVVGRPPGLLRISAELRACRCRAAAPPSSAGRRRRGPGGAPCRSSASTHAPVRNVRGSPVVRAQLGREAEQALRGLDGRLSLDARRARRDAARARRWCPRPARCGNAKAPHRERRARASTGRPTEAAGASAIEADQHEGRAALKPTHQVT